MSDLISKAAAIQAVFDWEQGKISGTIADAIAALPATDARPAWLSNCVICGRVVDTREKHEGGDSHGCEYVEGWTCSSECAEKLHPDPDWMKEWLATDARADALREAAAVCDTCPDSHWGPWMKARILALIDKPAPDAPQVFLGVCECGMTGPCMWDQCKHPLIGEART